MDLKQLATSLQAIMLNSSGLVPKSIGRYGEVELKSRNSLVTKVDKGLEAYFVEELSKLIPESGFIAEEGTSSKKGVKYTWIIDPLDGTTNFIHGIPCFCASIALVCDDELVLGGIYDFSRDEYFSAAKNDGAFLNGNPINVSGTALVYDGLIATGFPYYDFEFLRNYMALFEDLMNSSRGIRRLGSAALDLAYTACGRFDCFFEYSLHPWDVAAGALIIQEAGGKVTDFSGQNNFLFGGQILATNSKIHFEMLNKTNKYFK